MRIAIMGSGGVGGFFGALLARAGEDVVFIARGRHLQAMQTRGLTIKSSAYGDFTLPVRATDDPQTVGAVDLVLFGVKDYDLAVAAERMGPLIGSDTIVLTVQNGIDIAERLAAIIGQAPVVVGVTTVSARIEAPGVIVHTGGRPLVAFGEPAGGTSPRIERLRPILRSAGLNAELSSDIRIWAWQKFIGICASAGLTTLTRLPLGAILACPETAQLCRDALAEVAAVARAYGVPIGDQHVEAIFQLLAQYDPSTRASMYYDLEAGRRLELEDLNGAVVRLGRARGVATPVNAFIYAALKPYAAGAPAGTEVSRQRSEGI